MMDEMLERLNKYYPNSKFVEIPEYKPEQWIDKQYDSSLDTKAAINRWKTNPLTYEEAVALVENGKRIGWIVPKNYVIIDVDNKEEPRAQSYIERILEKFETDYSYNYTNHGIHMLFTDPSGMIKSGAKSKCALNLVVDTRANETGYIVLPCNDPHRAWGSWKEYIEPVPYFLKPLLRDLTTPSFIGMGEGDGRNDALFKWRGKLESTHGLTDAEIEKSIRIINEYLFDIALPNKELFSTVLRQRETKAIKEEKTNKYNEYANNITSKYNIIAYKDNFYMFNGLYYKAVDKVDLEQIIHNEVNADIGHAGRQEIVDFIKIKCQHSDTEFNSEWYKVATANGILNIISGELTPATPTDYNTIGIKYKYIQDPQPSHLMIDFMSSLTGGDILKEKFLYEVAGYCLLKKNIFQKFFIFRGEGGTGKSTFMNIILKLVGEENAAHVSLADFDKEYNLATLFGKLVNVDDDVVDNKKLAYTGKFKSVVAGEPIEARQIYHDIIYFVPFCTCIFSCNKLPTIMDDTSGMYRRIILIELNNKVENPDPLLLNKITDVDMEYFFSKSVEAIRGVIARGTFTINDSEQHLLEQFKRKQNTLLDFLSEHEMCYKDIVGQRCIALFSQYKAWLEQNGFKVTATSIGFKDDICRFYNVHVGTLYIGDKPVGQGFLATREDIDPMSKPW